MKKIIITTIYLFFGFSFTCYSQNALEAAKFSIKNGEKMKERDCYAKKIKCLKKKFKSCYNCKGFKGYDCSCGIISNIDKEFKNTALLNHHLVYHYDLVIDQKIKYTQRDFKTGKRKIVCAIVVEINDDNIVVKNQNLLLILLSEIQIGA